MDTKTAMKIEEASMVERRKSFQNAIQEIRKRRSSGEISKGDPIKALEEIAGLSGEINFSGAAKKEDEKDLGYYQLQYYHSTISMGFTRNMSSEDFANDKFLDFLTERDFSIYDDYKEIHPDGRLSASETHALAYYEEIISYVIHRIELTKYSAERIRYALTSLGYQRHEVNNLNKKDPVVLYTQEQEKTINLLVDRDALSGMQKIYLYRFPTEKAQDIDTLLARFERRYRSGAVGRFFFNIFGDTNYFRQNIVSQGNKALLKAAK